MMKLSWPLHVHEEHVMAMNSLYITNHDNKVQGILKAFSNSIQNIGDTVKESVRDLTV